VNRAEFVARLLALGRRRGPLPLYGSPEWEALDRLEPRRFAAVVVAAECWRTEGTDDAIRARLLDELAVADLLARWRVRMAGSTSTASWPTGPECSTSWTPAVRATRRWPEMGDHNGKKSIDDSTKKSISSVLVETALKLYDLGVSEVGETFAIPRTGPTVTHLPGGGTQPTGFSAEHHHRVSLGTGNTTSCADGLDCSTIGAGNAR
jgi:hypothetical protein